MGSLPAVDAGPCLLSYVWIRPVLTAFVESVTDSEGNLTINNFIAVFNDSFFVQAFSNSMIFALSSVVLSFVLAFLVALLLNRKFKGANILLFIALIPMAFPPTAVAILWKTGFTTFGWVNNILYSFGWIQEPILWLTAEGTEALFFLILIDTWTVMPSVMIILLAGLQNLNREFEEAAVIFGANRWQVIKDVIIPILRPTIVTSVILRMIGAIQVWMIAVMMFGYGRVPFLVERIAYYTDIVPMLENSYKMSLTYSVVVTIVVLVSVSIYLRLNRTGQGGAI